MLSLSTMISERPSSETGARDSMVSVLNKFPILCKTTCDCVRNDARYAPVMFYERTRMGAGLGGHFLEALPHGLSLFGVKPGVSRETKIRVELTDVAAERKTFIDQIEKQSRCGIFAKRVPRSVPDKVHRFVVNERSIAQKLRESSLTKSNVIQCRNQMCQRLTYCGRASCVDSRDPRDRYWDMFDTPNERLQPHAGMFCTWFCRDRHHLDMKRLQKLLPDELLRSDDACRKEGRARVSEALRLCVKRNAETTRILRRIESEGMVFSVHLKSFVSRFVRRVNIDLGLLYVSSILAESKTLASGKALAGVHADWRKRPELYHRAIKKVAVIYSTRHLRGSVISNLHTNEPFLTELRANCRDIF